MSFLRLVGMFFRFSQGSLIRLTGKSINVPPASICRKLVPFGRSYQNIEGDLSVSPSEVVTYISGGRADAAYEFLGSPFPLEAVMSATCFWGRRFFDVIAFPVGFDRRIIYRKDAKTLHMPGAHYADGDSQKYSIF